MDLSRGTASAAASAPCDLSTQPPETVQAQKGTCEGVQQGQAQTQAILNDLLYVDIS